MEFPRMHPPLASLDPEFFDRARPTRARNLARVRVAFRLSRRRRRPEV